MDSKQQVKRNQWEPRIHLGMMCMTEHRQERKYQEGRRCMLRSLVRIQHHNAEQQTHEQQLQSMDNKHQVRHC